MVRTTVAFAVIALGAAAVLAQVPEGSSQLEARDLDNDLELREYGVDDLEARSDLEDVDTREPELFFEEIDAREPEFFDDIEAREYEAEEFEARDEDLEARAPAQNPLPSNTVTTITPTPTPCTQKELKTQKEQTKVDKALAVLRSAKGKKDLSRKDKQQVKKARKYLRRVRRRRVRAAKRTVKKCRGNSSAKCKDASKYLQHSKKSSKSKASRKSGNLLAASKTTVGSDGVPTVTVNAGPTCTPASGSSSRLRKRLIIRDIVDEEFDSVFAREYEFDNLD